MLIMIIIMTRNYDYYHDNHCDHNEYDEDTYYQYFDHDHSIIKMMMIYIFSSSEVGDVS